MGHLCDALWDLCDGSIGVATQGGNINGRHEKGDVAQSIKKFISATLLFNRFMKDIRIGLLQLNIIYEGQ